MHRLVTLLIIAVVGLCVNGYFRNEKIDDLRQVVESNYELVDALAESNGQLQTLLVDHHLRLAELEARQTFLMLEGALTMENRNRLRSEIYRAKLLAMEP